VRAPEDEGFPVVEHAREGELVSVDVQVEVVIDRPVGEVASFAGDPGNAPRWYANIASVSWQTPPPVSVRSRMDFVAHFLGRALASPTWSSSSS
jgi:hypothetical protein